MNQKTVMLAVFVALGVTLVAGLMVIPALHQAQAISSTALANNKGRQGNIASDGKRQGRGGVGSGPSCADDPRRC